MGEIYYIRLFYFKSHVYSCPFILTNSSLSLVFNIFFNHTSKIDVPSRILSQLWMEGCSEDVILLGSHNDFHRINTALCFTLSRCFAAPAFFRGILQCRKNFFPDTHMRGCLGSGNGQVNNKVRKEKVMTIQLTCYL